MQLVGDLQSVERMLDSLALFSSNESLDELCTASLPYYIYHKRIILAGLRRYMAVQYWLGVAVQKMPTGGSKEERKHLLMAAKSCLDEFARLLASYQIIFDNPAKKSGMLDMTGERMVRIERMRRVKVLEVSLKERRQAGIIESRSVDEEVIRTFRLDELEICALKAIQERSLIESELEILSRSPDEMPHSDTPTRRTHKNIRQIREPFTLLKSRQDVHKSVFRPGHNLPTMTIDEYLAVERQRGGILGNNTGELVSDDSDGDDEGRREEKIRMDLYRDEHRRGSGNTYNRS